MIDAPAPRFAWKDGISIACAVIGAAFIIGGKVRDDGARDARIADNTRRIEALEHDAPDKAKTRMQILERTARIETKLEMIAPPKDRRP